MDQSAKAEQFRKLHTGPDILVLPNAWDAISARIVEAEGFRAVATSSAGMASVLGYPDGQRIPWSEMQFLVGRIVASVNVPVTVDVEAGYGDPVRTAFEVIGTGAVGMNLEDMANHELIPLAEQLSIIRAIKVTTRSAGVPIVLNARTDIFLAKHGDPETRFDRAVERLQVFYREGADCLFAPGVTDAETIGRLVDALKGPLNILTSSDCPSIPELKRLGVKRVSFGSGTSRVALGMLQRFVRQIQKGEDVSQPLREAISYHDVQTLLSR